MKHIEVVAAIIVHDGKILATQRGYGNYRQLGVLPAARSNRARLPRRRSCARIHEELDADIKVGPKLITVDYDYPRVRDDDAVLCLHARQ